MLSLEQLDLIVGVDVGKDIHHAVALDRTGRTVLDRALPNAEPALRALLLPLGEPARIALVVDQPATVGALPDLQMSMTYSASASCWDGSTSTSMYTALTTLSPAVAAR